MKPSQAGLVLTVLILLFCAFSLHSIRSVEPRAADAPADEFSVERAWRYLEAIAQKPHPTGSVEIERVRNYLVEQLETMGLEPDIQSTTVIAPNPWQDGSLTAGSVHNIVARFLGSERGKAVLLMAHYDSVKTGPGAADDGAGVAALLETLRALKAGEALANDVIVLLTDAEEAGLLGARAFFDQHSWAKDVGLVLNFEARGHYGPSLMFETSEGNAALISEFAKIDVPKLSYSYGYEVYKRMPNDTDFTISNRAGIPGLNFAFIHGLNRYHSQLDDLERLNRGSVQHHGEFALALTRLFGQADLEANWQEGQNAIYFTLFGPIFIRYPGSLALPLALLLLVGTILCFRHGVRRGRLSLGRSIAALLILLLISLLLGGAFMAFAGQLISPFYSYSLANGWNSTSLSLLAISLLWSAVAVVAFGWIYGKWSDNLLAGGLLFWTFLTIAMTLVAPGASYLFAIPLLVGLIAGFVWFGRNEEATTIPISQLVILALSGIVIVLIWAPTFAFIGVALGAPTALLVGLFGTAALWGLMTPQLDLLGNQRRIFALILAVVGLGLVIWVQMASQYDEVNRRPNSMLYAYDTESGEASWFSFDRAVDDWTQQFLGESPERAELPSFLGSRSRRAHLTAPAPMATHLGAASIEPLGERPDEQGGTIIDFQIGWPFHAEDALIYLRTEGQIQKVQINDQIAEITGSSGPGDENSRVLINYVGASQGLLMSVTLAGSEPLTVETVGRDHGLPQLEGFSYEPRPGTAMPQLGRLVDTTNIRGIKVLTPGAVMPSEEEAGEDEEEPLEEAA